METTIVPCRAEISDRFPVASFAVNVPPTRCFEVACATDPRLFHTDWKRYRSPRNFYSSRAEGLMRAPGGHTAWFIPPEQLRHFVGAPRIYYALATYENAYGGSPEFTISPDTLDRVPSIAVSGDFTGRGLDRTRLGAPPPEPDGYGAVGAGTLTWGGDDALAAYRAAAVPQGNAYDDGYSRDLWEEEGAATEHPEEGVGVAAGVDELAFDLGADCRDDEDPGDPTGAAMHDDGPVYEPWESGGLGDSYDEEPADVPAAEWEGDGYGAVHDDAEPEDEEPEDDEADEARYGGYEDAASLYAAGAPVVEAAEPPAYGGADGYPEEGSGVAVLEPAAEDDAYPAAEAEALSGRDPLYSEEEPEEEPLPVGRAARALATVALDVPEKVRVLRVVAVAESGRDGYSAVNPDSEYNDPRHPAYQRYHIGLSWGFVQFTQRSGALGRVLQAIKRREDAPGAAIAAEHRFEQLFGPHWEELLRVTSASDPEARVAPVGGKVLWDPEWVARFRAAGRVPHVTYAQNEVAVTGYVDPNLRIAAWLGFDTARALAMLCDRCIHMGNGGGIAWIMRACGPVRTEEDRRAALGALGHADLRAFQQSQAPHLRVDGAWGARTHAALTGALRVLGARSPLAVPSRDDMLQRMVEAARGTRFHARLAALHSNRTDFDDGTLYLQG